MKKALILSLVFSSVLALSSCVYHKNVVLDKDKQSEISIYCDDLGYYVVEDDLYALSRYFDGDATRLEAITALENLDAFCHKVDANIRNIERLTQPK